MLSSQHLHMNKLNKATHQFWHKNWSIRWTEVSGVLCQPHHSRTDQVISTDKTNDSFLTNSSQLYSGDDLVQVEMSVITSDSSYFQAYSYLDNQTT